MGDRGFDWRRRIGWGIVVAGVACVCGVGCLTEKTHAPETTAGHELKGMSEEDRIERLRQAGFVCERVSGDMADGWRVDLGGAYKKRVATRDLRPLAGLRVVELGAQYSEVEDLSPLRAMPLKKLDIRSSRVSDLSALKGLAITNLNLHRCCPVADLSPLQGMPLVDLEIGQTSVRSLEPLRGMPLNRLHMEVTDIPDLSPLKGMPLARLFINYTTVTNLSDVVGCL